MSGSVAFQLVGIHITFLVIVNVLGHLPNLHDIVFGHGTNDPRLVRVPREIGYFCSVTAVYEQELWWSVFNVVGRLFFAYFAQIPHVQASVCATGREYCLVVR